MALSQILTEVAGMEANFTLIYPTSRSNCALLHG
jgi:hypothetical protein